MGDASGEEQPSPQEFIEQALIEAHHLANLTGLDEAKLARRQLVNAQSATRRTKTRDLLSDACEFLELASMKRRDATTGFVKARRYARNAEIILRDERPIPTEHSVSALLNSPFSRNGTSLEELRQELSVGSYESLRTDTILDPVFDGLRGQTTDGLIEEPNVFDSDPFDTGDPVDGGPHTDGEPIVDVEEALRLASLEVDIRHALQNAREARAEAEFEFVSSDQVVSAETREDY